MDTKLAVRAKYKKGDEPGKDLEVEIDLGAFLEAVNLTFDVIKAGVTAGSASNHLAMMHSLMFADILHGGAYKGSVKNLPYYNPALRDDIGVYQGPPALRFDLGTGGEVQEAIIDGNVPHVLPKILSDLAYGNIRAWFNTFNKIEAIGNGGTALTSLVEGVKGVTDVGGRVAAGVANPAAFLAAQIRQMTARTETKK